MGGAGMLGHKLLQVLGARFETWATVRDLNERLRKTNLFPDATTVAGVDATAFDSIVGAFARVRPDVVINCIGIIKQRPQAKDPVLSLRVNSLLPHQLNQLCVCAGARLIHISTDCVFSGQKGRYDEAAMPDASDLYGRSKLMGEVTDHGALTLRTSIIGRELSAANGLLEWFLANRGRSVQGFSRAIFSGLPTIVLAHVVADIIEKQPKLSGLFHVGSDPIDKYELLRLFDEAFDTKVEVRRNDDIVIDRSLDSSRFRNATGFVPDPWPTLVTRMASDATYYGQMERQ